MSHFQSITEYIRSELGVERNAEITEALQLEPYIVVFTSLVFDVFKPCTIDTAENLILHFSSTMQ